MVIVETAIFTRKITALMTDDSYRLLQNALLENPPLGDLIPGGGGIRKVRWALPGSGKRGGIRVIYYWAVRRDTLVMLYAYAKNELENLTQAQLNALAKAVKEEFGHE
jgi:hypothetical protein